MKSFPEWFKELCSDVRWFEYTSMNHKGKNFKKAAEFVYAQLLADSRLQMREMSENRKHVYNKLGSMPFDFVAPSLQQEEKKEEKSNIVETYTPEYAAMKKKEALDIIAKSEILNRFPKVSYKQSVEEGDWLPKKPAPYPSTSPMEYYIRQRHLEYIKSNYDARTGQPLPNWIDEQVFNKDYDERHLANNNL